MQRPKVSSSPNSLIPGTELIGRTKVCRLNAGRVAIFALVVIFAAACPGIGQAQNCNSLAASGDTTGNTDWSNITNCLNGSNHVTLQAGTFYISQPVKIPAANASFIGAGKNSTFLIPTYDCSQSGVISVNGQGGALVNDTLISSFKMELVNCVGTGGEPCTLSDPAVDLPGGTQNEPRVTLFACLFNK